MKSKHRIQESLPVASDLVHTIGTAAPNRRVLDYLRVLNCSRVNAIPESAGDQQRLHRLLYQTVIKQAAIAATLFAFCPEQILDGRVDRTTTGHCAQSASGATTGRERSGDYTTPGRTALSPLPPALPPTGDLPASQFASSNP